MEQSKSSIDLESVAETTGSEPGRDTKTETFDEKVLSYLEQVEEAWMKRKEKKDMQRTCISGGAKGADALWCTAAQNAGFDVFP